MFATTGFVLEYDYATLRGLWGGTGMLASWLELLGSISAFVLGVWFVVASLFWLLGRGEQAFYGLSGRLARVHPEEVWKPRSFWLLAGLAAVALGAAGVAWLVLGKPPQTIVWIGCASALLAVCWEFLLDAGKLSSRRIWALARFSIKEAIRRRALWSFCVILAVFLFASWFMPIYRRPEDQWRNYVDLVFFMTTALLLITASVVGCFSLPTDIQRQTIHTVVTKPVQRFEIVIGRVIGFTILMTVVLVVLSLASLLYVFRGISQEARDTSMRARVPVFVDKDNGLRFEELDAQGSWSPRQGQLKVGREWEYLEYLKGGSTQEAVYVFPAADLPGSLLDQAAEAKRLREQLEQPGADDEQLRRRLRQLERIPIEFVFDIFRTSKGGESYKEGVVCQLSFVNTNKWNYRLATEYREALDEATKLPLSSEQKASRYGYYELPVPITVTDYERYTLTFPAGVLEDIGGRELQIRVACRSHSQYLGVARANLYILAEEASFFGNFLKGVTGIWFLLVLVVAIGVVFSTYLNAIVSLMLTWVLAFCGLPRIRDFIEGLATSGIAGGGPGESFLRLIWQQNVVTPLEATPGVRAVQVTDQAFQVMFRGMLKILPDLGQYDRTMFVAEGFSIPGSELLAAGLMLIGYLFPFLVLGYYLINSREVAG